MAGARSSHEQKSRAERENYVRTTVRKNPTPTIDETFTDTDSTETLKLAETTFNRTATPRSTPSPLAEYFREHLAEIIFGAILLPVLAFLCYQVFSLNREVGEVRGQIEQTRAQGQRLETQLEKLNDRIDRLSQRPEGDSEK